VEQEKADNEEEGGVTTPIGLYRVPMQYTLGKASPSMAVVFSIQGGVKWLPTLVEMAEVLPR